MEELRTRDSLDMMSQQQKITYLEDKVRQLSKFEQSMSFYKLFDKNLVNNQITEYLLN